MHPIQKKLLELSQRYDLSALGLRQITRMVGETHPQKVKHHMQQLGFLKAPPASKAAANHSKLISIPLMGLANCGEATIYADSYDNQCLQISQTLISQPSEHLFAIQAVGDSMNQANIHGNNIESGDYVLINPDDKDFRDGDYVLSIINNMANIKKYTRDINNHQVILISESTENYPPIYIHEDDMAYFMASGKVIDVLKKPKNNSNDFVITKI